MPRRIAGGMMESVTSRRPILQWCLPGGVAGLMLWFQAALPHPARAEPARQAHWSTNYYRVTGATLREIQDSIRRNRPGYVEREGFTQWNVRSRFGVVRFQDRYRCGGFTTTTVIRLTLPRWTPPSEAADAVREEWARYIGALTEHELGHAQFALAAAAELHRRVGGVGMDTDADRLKDRVQQIILRTTEEFQERDREYDRLTRYGLTQGAVLGLRRDGAGDQPTR